MQERPAHDAAIAAGGMPAGCARVIDAGQERRKPVIARAKIKPVRTTGPGHLATAPQGSPSPTGRAESGSARQTAPLPFAACGDICPRGAARERVTARASAAPAR
jgi:hypothetical protein